MNHISHVSSSITIIHDHNKFARNPKIKQSMQTAQKLLWSRCVPTRPLNYPHFHVDHKTCTSTLFDFGLGIVWYVKFYSKKHWSPVSETVGVNWKQRIYKSRHFSWHNLLDLRIRIEESRGVEESGGILGTTYKVLGKEGCMDFVLWCLDKRSESYGISKFLWIWELIQILFYFEKS